MFRDQIFTQNKQRVMELCDEIINKDLNIKWLVEARANQVSYDLLRKMKEAGCVRIHFGVETGSSKLIDVAKPGSNLDSYKKAFQICKDLGIFTVAHIIVGLPGESEETIKETINFLQYLNPNDVSVNIITPYPGTKLFKLAIEKEWILTFNWAEYTGFNAIMKTDNLTHQQLVEIRKKMKNKFRKFKILHDPVYRRNFIRSIPRKICNRYKLFNYLSRRRLL